MAQLDDTKPKASDDEDEFLRKAKERFTLASDYWGPKYQLSRDDKKFYSGNSENNLQWPDSVINSMSPGRPRLTINRLPQFHNQIVNDYRQATLGFKAAPQREENKEVAQTYTGLFRQIEKQSYAQVVYLTALSDAAIGGLGWWRVITKYARSDSFDQDIFIERVVNASRVLPDPAATGFFLEDGQFLFYIDKMSYDDYEDEYDHDPEDFTTDEFSDHWRDSGNKQVTLAEYFYFKTVKRTLVQFSDGTTGWEDELKTGAATYIVNKRKTSDKQLHWCKMDGYHVLDKKAWPTPRIPFVPVWGNELWVEDERTFEGQVRGVKDSQRMYNYMQSTKTEMIALAPKAPYIAAEGQLEGREDEWRDAAITPKSVLYYKPVSVDGVIVPPPQRQSYEAPVAAIIQASMQASDDMKATLGVYDASLGARGNEVSGRAINARKQEGDTATYNYVDNLSMSMDYTGTIVAELIPIIYDTKRMLRITTDDNKTKMVEVNGEGTESPNLVDVQYDLDIDTGPSFSTQRQESVAIITDLSQNFPKIMEVAGDIAVRNMNFKGSDEIADRLKRTLPPQVVGEDADPVTKLAAAQNELAQLKQAMSEMAPQIQEKDAKIAEQALELKNKAGELRIKQQEVSLKRTQLNMQGDKEKGDQDSANEESSSVMAALSEISAKVDELTEMVESVVDESAAPADENNSEAPAPVEPPVTAPDQPTT